MQTSNEPLADPTGSSSEQPSSGEGAETADRVAAAVLAVPGVHELHGGPFGEVATYLPGRRVPGVTIRDHTVSVHVVLDWGANLAGTTKAVRTAVQGVAPGAVDVTVEDIREPEQS